MGEEAGAEGRTEKEAGAPVRRSKAASEEYHTAVHEAGHAVAAFLLHEPIKTVSIIPDPENGSAGHVLHVRAKPPKTPLRFPKAIRDERDPERRAFMEQAWRQTWEAENSPEISPDRPRVRDWLERQIMCTYAGEAACRLVERRKDREGPRADFHQIVQNLSRVAAPGKEETLYLSWLWERTRNLLKPHRAAIQALARELLARKEIGGRQAFAIIRRAVWSHVEAARARWKGRKEGKSA